MGVTNVTMIELNLDANEEDVRNLVANLDPAEATGLLMGIILLLRDEMRREGESEQTIVDSLNEAMEGNPFGLSFVLGPTSRFPNEVGRVVPVFAEDEPEGDVIGTKIANEPEPPIEPPVEPVSHCPMCGQAN